MTDIYKKTAEEFVEYANGLVKEDKELDYDLSAKYNSIAVAVDLEATGCDMVETAIVHAAAKRFDGTERIEGHRRWRHLLSPHEQRRLRWARYAASALVNLGFGTSKGVAEWADVMLAEEESRFGRDE